LALVLNSPFGQEFIWSNVKESAQPCLYLGKTQQMPVPLPPLAEQRRIVSKVDELMGLLDRLEAKFREAQETQAAFAAAAVHHLDA
jgi:type I restriction enzyme S subunit